MDIYQYQASTQADWTMLRWHQKLLASGEFPKVLGENNKIPSAFYSFFATRPLFVTCNNQGDLNRACWWESFMCGVFMGIWVAKEERKLTRDNLRFWDNMLQRGFEQYPAILGAIQERSTPQETQKFIALHCKFGYELSGAVNYIFDGKRTHFVTAYKETWQEARKKYAKVLEGT